jgi:multiple sugar transport system permease protein
MKKSKRDFTRDKKMEIFCGLLPIIILISIVTLLPSVSAFGISLFRTKYMNIESFVGLYNFIRFFSNTYAFLNIRSTLIFVVVSVVFSIPIAFILALLLNRSLPGTKFFRSILIIPYVLAQIVIALMWKWILDPTYGPVNYYFQQLFNIGKIDFIGSSILAMPTLILVNVWRTYPMPLIMILSALQTIPHELKEAALIDGASWHHIIRKITIPWVSYSVAIGAIMLTLENFTMVTLILIMTGGGPLRLTETLGMRVYIEAFQAWNISMAAAIGVMIFVCNTFFGYSYIRFIYKGIEA